MNATRWRPLMSVLALVAFPSWLVAQSALKAPLAKEVEHISIYHGQKFNDPFYWLREKNNPDTIKHLEAENAYTQAMTKDLEPFAETVYKEMLGHIKQTDSSVPIRRGPYHYYSRMEEGKQYEIRCRKKAAADGSLDDKAPEEILLDLNELAKGHKFFSVGAFAVSDDDNLLAYTTDTNGYRQYRLHVKNLRTGALLPDTADRVTSIEWCADGKTLFYTTEDSVTKRSNIAWRLELGNESEPVYWEKDRLFRTHVTRSKDKKLLFLVSTSTDTWETRYLPSETPEGSFKVVLPREKGHKYSVEHRDGLFYLRTNRDAKNYRLVTAPVADPSPKNWKELLPHRADVLLQAVEVFRDHLVASEKSAALV